MKTFLNIDYQNNTNVIALLPEAYAPFDPIVDNVIKSKYLLN